MAEKTIKEFMEWFVSEYDGHWLPPDITPVINRLEGYSLAKRGSDESFILESSLTMLREFRTLLERIKSETNWKYK